jgi:hypothetical protein
MTGIFFHSFTQALVIRDNVGVERLRSKMNELQDSTSRGDHRLILGEEVVLYHQPLCENIIIIKSLSFFFGLVSDPEKENM